MKPSRLIKIAFTPKWAWTALAAVFITGTAHAQTNGTWTATTGNWSNSANWSGGNIASGTDATATIDNSPTITLDANYTIGTFASNETAPGWNITLTGSSPSSTLTFATSTGTPSLALNSQYNGTFYWGNMTVAGNQGLNLDTGYNTAVLQTGLSWTATGTLKFTPDNSNDVTSLYAQGNNVLAGTMDLNMTAGNGGVLILNGGTTQTIGALTGSSTDYIAGYSGTGLHNNTPTGANTSAATSGATLQIGSTNDSGTFAGTIGSNSSTDTSAASAAVAVVKVGTGTQTFSSANLYTGGTTISAGTLSITNTTGSATGTGAVGVNSGGTFGGTGITTGAVTVNSGGILTPGVTSAVGTLNVGTLTLNSGSILDYYFGASTNSLTTVTGTLTLDGGGFNLYQTGTTTAFDAPGLYNLFDYTGTLGGSLSDLSVLNGQSGYSYTFDTTGTVVQLNITAPEPKPLGMIALGLAGLVVVLRRRVIPLHRTDA